MTTGSLVQSLEVRGGQSKAVRRWIRHGESTDLLDYQAGRAESSSEDKPRSPAKSAQLRQAIITADISGVVDAPDAQELPIGTAGDARPRWVLTQSARTDPDPEFDEFTLEPTSGRADLGRIQRRIDAVFAEARDEVFEDGMESEFSRQLLSLVESSGNDGMSEIAYLIAYDQVNNWVASEALRWIGRMEDPETHGYRFWLLRESLGAPSPVVRDGAALGLASLNDRAAIPCLKEAIGREPIVELREDMALALADLETSAVLRRLSS